MQIHITARHIDLTPAISEYARRKIEKTQKFFGNIISAQAILSVQKVRHIAEFVVHMPGETFRVDGEAGDLYAAIDRASHKLDLHMRKVKEKRTNLRYRKTPKGFVTETGAIGNVVAVTETAVTGYDKISELSKVSAKWISVEKALEELDESSKPYFLFVNEDTNRLNLIYRRAKKGCGLVEIEDPHF